jgi:hypothetical protein
MYLYVFEFLAPQLASFEIKEKPTNLLTLPHLVKRPGYESFTRKDL